VEPVAVGLEVRGFELDPGLLDKLVEHREQPVLDPLLRVDRPCAVPDDVDGEAQPVPDVVVGVTRRRR
jgi:hypothetical protein